MSVQLERLGSYERLSPAGEGGFARIYRGYARGSDTPVAIKVPLPEYLRDPEFIRRFEAEAQKLLALPPHPNVVRGIEFGTSEGVPYLVMEYLEGVDLSTRVGAGRRLGVAEAVEIGAQMASALGFLHARGFIHRDVKPENIRLTKAGAKLLDFGIARVARESHVTRAGIFPGTPQYVAPEVWEGAEATPPTDVYALGIVLYEALGGRVPYGGTDAAIMAGHVRGRPVPLSAIRPDLPGAVEAAVLRAMARAPGDRFRSAADLAMALRAPAHLSGPVPNARPAAPYRPQSAVSGVPLAYLLLGNREIPVNGGALRIGRAPQCDVPVRDPAVTPVHAQVERNGRTYAVRDLGSPTGTYVNGRRITGEGAVLRNGDEIRLGRTRMTFALAGLAGRGYRSSRLDSAAKGWAAACHASAVLTIAAAAVPVVPALIPLLLWLVGRRHSTAVGFQARQATLFQLTIVLLMLVSGPTFRPFVWLLAAGIGCFAAIRCLEGMTFRYPLLAEVAERWR